MEDSFSVGDGIVLGGGGGVFLFVILSPFIGSIFGIFSYFIIALFFRHRVLKFIDLYLSRQACKLSFIIRVTGKFVAFSLSVLSFVFLGGGELS